MNFVLSDGTRVHLIGDPHLGKRFEVGVPLHRRGERETRQMVHFQKELDTDADIIVIVGDLFDHPYVPYGTVDATAKALRGAAERNPDIDYLVMAGNHDLPRNIAAVGAFHDLEDRLADRLPNLLLVRKPLLYRSLVLFPWEWDRSALSQVKILEGKGSADVAIGHWDMVAHDGKDAHLAPVVEIRRVFGDAIKLYSGHYHTPGDYIVEGITVVGTGSMEPYSHGEDPNGTLYVTMGRAEALEAHPDELRNKNVRLRLAPGEDVPVIDALAVTVQRATVQPKQADGNTLSLKDFDWNAILSRRIKPLDPTVKDFIRERLPYDETSE